MIVVENPKPSLSEFKELMAKIDRALNYSASVNSSYFAARGGTKLEEDVQAAAIECAKHTKFEGSIHLVSGATFPDIVAAKYYGIEVKSSHSNNWKTIGNSILETTRVADVERIFLTFGKLSDPVEFRSRPYEECLSGIAVTHYPRYQIDMSLGVGETIFDKMGVEYDDFRTMQNPVIPVAEYYKKQLKPGERLWWAGGSIETAVPVIVRLWGSLSPGEKDELESAIYAYFPETILSKNSHKYDRATLWLATQKGIINANVRDSFSAGGRVDMPTNDGRIINVRQVFNKIATHIDRVAEIILSESTDVLSENWQESIQTDRIEQWLNLVVSYSNNIAEKDNARRVLDKLFHDYKSKI